MSYNLTFYSEVQVKDGDLSLFQVKVLSVHMQTYQVSLGVAWYFCELQLINFDEVSILTNQVFIDYQNLIELDDAINELCFIYQFLARDAHLKST